MRRPKLTFIKSNYGNLTYKVYRSKTNNENDDYILGKDCDFTVSERKIDAEKLNINNVKMSQINKQDNLVELTTYFEFIRPNSSFEITLPNLNVSIVVDTSSSSTISSIVVKLNNEIIKTYTTSSLISAFIKIINSNTILYNSEEFKDESYLLSSCIDTIEYIDKDVNGLFTPSITCEENNDFLIIKQNLNNIYNTYYYRCYGETSDSSVTEISTSHRVDISEPLENLNTIVEYSGDLIDWTEINEYYSPSDVIKLYKDKNEIAISECPGLMEYEINCDDRYIISDNLRILSIYNPFHLSKIYLNERTKKAYRIKNVLTTNESECSKYSNIVNIIGAVNIKIEQMIVLTKDVTGLNDDVANLPLTFNDKDVETLMCYIRQGSKSYMDYLNNDYEIKNKPSSQNIITIVSENSRFVSFEINTNVLHSNKYNYTVYLVDEIGNISKPVCKVF